MAGFQTLHRTAPTSPVGSAMPAGGSTSPNTPTAKSAGNVRPASPKLMLGGSVPSVTRYLVGLIIAEALFLSWLRGVTPHGG